MGSGGGGGGRGCGGDIMELSADDSNNTVETEQWIWL